MQIKFVDLGRQYKAIQNEIDDAIRGVIASGQFVLGPSVEEFETAFAAFCGVRYCVGVASGTDALTIALATLGIGHGDEVILPANTSVATAIAVSCVGATPVLVDVDPDTLLMTGDVVERAITVRTRAIIPVHLFGAPVDIEPIVALAKSRGVALVENACQAHGAMRNGKRVGSFGIASAFSFFPAKNLGAFGDGGAIVTSSREIAEAARVLRDLGQRNKYNHVVKGFNSRLDTLQAAILNVKLAFLDSWNAARRERASWYETELRNAGYDGWLPPWRDGVYYAYPIRSANRTKITNALRAADIEFGIHYPAPIHLQVAYNDLGYERGRFPVSEQWSESTLSLPMFPELEREEVVHIARVVGAASQP